MNKIYDKIKDVKFAFKMRLYRENIVLQFVKNKLHTKSCNSASETFDNPYLNPDYDSDEEKNGWRNIRRRDVCPK